MTLAHIAGVPVEETIGMFAPVLAAVGLASERFRSRWRTLRARRAGKRESDR